MQENNFEKEVRKKMDELSFVPSPPVWEKVEERIRKKKDRRRILFWFIPFVLLGTGGVVWLTNGEQKHQPGTGNALQKAAAEKINSNGIPEKKENQQSDNRESETRLKPKLLEKNPVVLEKDDALLIEKTTKKENRSQEIHYRSPVLPTRLAEANAVKEPKPIKNKKISNAEPLIAQADSRVADPQKDAPVDQMPSATHTQKGDSMLDANPVIASLPASDSAQKKQNNKTNKSRWQWGLQARLGVSGMSSGLLNLGGQKSLDAYAASPTNASAGGGTTLPPADVHKGFSFSIGTSIKKNLNKRHALTVGLQYAFYGTHQEVGKNVFRDTVIRRSTADALSLSNYYRNDLRRSDYCNRYHFIELPVAWEYRPFRRLPLRTQAGMSISRLVATDALFYDRNADVYYEDDSRLKKTGLNLLTALHYPLLNKEKMTLQIGPQAQYGLRSLNKSGKKQHLYFVGVNAEISF